jgi:hypothetical protein
MPSASNREITVFKGKAELIDPETGKVVATFTEDGDKMKVVLKSPETLTGTARLAIYSTVKDEELIAATAKDGHDTKIHEFHGVSPLGALTDKAEISLTRSPGGPLGTLLIVLGRGTIHEEHHR